MALVVSSTPLAALWSKTETITRDEKRPPGSSAGSPSRRLSNESSSAPTAESSSAPTAGSSSFNTQNSSSTNNTSVQTESKKKQKQKRTRRGRDIVLHVQDCAFAVHERVLKRKCRVLHGFVVRLREQTAVAYLAGGGDDDHESNTLSLVAMTGVPALPTGGSVDGVNEFESRDKQFALKPRNPMSAVRNSSRSGQCPLLPRQQLSDRVALSTSSPRSPRFPQVCCVAHQKAEPSERSDHGDLRPRSTLERLYALDEISPGKENYGSTLTTASALRPRPRPVPRIALAPKMPFTTSQTVSLRGSLSKLTNSPIGSSPSDRSSLPDSTRAAPNAFAVELVGASADGVATFIEFLYSGKTSGLNESNAATVTSLCKWFCMEDHLLYAALIVRAKAIRSVVEWMEVLLCCTSLRSESKRAIVINFLLQLLMKLSMADYRNAMDLMPLHRLAAIEDADVLARVVLVMINHVRRMETWHKLTFALELWLFWTYRRPFVGSEVDGVCQPMSLTDFHHQFVAWNPVVRIQDVEVSGMDAYVHPTTLFSFGPFEFQVRLEVRRSPLISWRVVRTGTPADANECEFRPGLEPSFCLRGNLTLVYKLSPEGQLLQEDVAVRYSHSKEVFNDWHVLLASPSLRAQVMVAEPESEEKAQEPDSSLEESAPHERSLSAFSARATAGGVEPPTRRTRASSEEGSPFDLMAASFSGQFFVWGHKLCNWYHFLLLSTLFYQIPEDAPRELRLEATQTRLRQLPVDTLIPVLQSDRLQVPEGETTLAVAVARLCLSDYGTVQYTLDQIRSLFQCVRWCFVDLEQIMLTLEHSRRELQLYELVEQQLHDHYNRGSRERRAPWGILPENTPYRVTTTLIEFQIEAGDRSLSPSKFSFSQEL